MNELGRRRKIIDDRLTFTAKFCASYEVPHSEARLGGLLAFVSSEFSKKSTDKLPEEHHGVSSALDNHREIWQLIWLRDKAYGALVANLNTVNMHSTTARCHDI